MSFLFETFQVPLWFLVFAFGCAAPLWIKWYKWFYNKFIVAGVIQKIFSKKGQEFESEDISILQKATDGWNTSVEKDIKTAEIKKSSKKYLQTEADQPYVKIVLKALAMNGDAGMLLQSISDKLEIGSNEIKSALSYLEKNEFIDAVGSKYYLVERGKRYCIKRGYIKE